MEDPGADRPARTPGYPGLLLVASAGLLSGAFAAVAYYSTSLRIVLAVLVTRRQAACRAIVRAIVALAAAVVAFYVGKKVVYGIEYAGMPYEIDLVTLATWLALAGVAGTVFGLAFRYVGHDGCPAASPPRPQSGSCSGTPSAGPVRMSSTRPFC
ncbi:hypothetical protein [Qaidamihabitans albus]|uniref:hypothetical protein n=1 Tax=Qaidamihabitans albus TaxID=2795733 RepID=UPI0018F1BB50|nr:hypothetical protein [Qaidamihabitans albus]